MVILPSAMAVKLKGAGKPGKDGLKTPDLVCTRLQFHPVKQPIAARQDNLLDPEGSFARIEIPRFEEKRFGSAHHKPMLFHDLRFLRLYVFAKAVEVSLHVSR